MSRIPSICLFAFLANGLGLLPAAPPPATITSAGEVLLNKIWTQAQITQKTYTSWSGPLTEVRTSILWTAPITYRGKFFASGTDKFRLEYTQPEPMTIIYNGGILNIVTGRESRRREVVDVGSGVRRAQQYFSQEASLKNLKENFVITAEEDSDFYDVRLVPKTGRFEKRLNHMVIRLAKRDCLPRRLEVEGKSGVKSVFQIEMQSVNSPLDEALFEVMRP